MYDKQVGSGHRARYGRYAVGSRLYGRPSYYILTNAHADAYGRTNTTGRLQ